MRFRTKNKVSVNKKAAGGTGGGPFTEEVLTATEEEVLTVIKKVSIDGHDVPESTVEFVFEEDNAIPAAASEIVIHDPVVEENAANFEVDSDDIAEVLPPATEFALLQNVILEPCTMASARSDPESALKDLTNKTKPFKGKMPKKLEHLINAATAATCFKENLNKKVSIKEAYYQQKITLLQEMKLVEEKKVAALERIANALEQHRGDS